MSSQGNLEMNFQSKEDNQNLFLPPPQPNQFVNSQPYIDPNFINQNQNGIYIGQNNNIQVQSLPNQNSNEVNNECKSCCKISLITLGCICFIFIIIIVIVLCTGGLNFSFDNTDCEKEPEHPDC